MKRIKTLAKAAESVRDHPLRAKAMAFAVAAALSPTLQAQNLPTGVNTVTGNVTVSNPTATSMLLNQTSQNAGMTSQSFSIGSGYLVDIRQPSTSSVMVMDVLGGTRSSIFGTLTVTGHLFLVNPAGTVFAPGANVAAGGGFVASSLPISYSDATSGRYVFTNNGNSGSIEVKPGATITALNGYVGLFAPKVLNEGLIVARMGSVALAAGNQVTLDMVGDGLIKVAVNEAALNASVMNKGTIEADGGNVLLTARSANALLDTVINTDGIIRANSIANRNGTIVLDGGDRGVVSVAGTVEAKGIDAGTTGGTVKVLGQYVGLGLSGASTMIDASGDAGGGTVLVGGNYQGLGPEQNATATYVGTNATINVDAVTTGNGGKTIVWADDSTRFFGTITARGGSQGGDGGFVEISGKETLVFNGKVDTRAPRGNTGMLLLDPLNITITDAANGGADDGLLGASDGTIATTDNSVDTGNSTLGTAFIAAGTLEAVNSTTSINLNARQNIAIQPLTGGGLGHTTLLLAQGTGNSATFNAGADGTGTFSMNTANGIQTQGGNLIINGPSGITAGSLATNGSAVATGGTVTLTSTAGSVATGAINTNGGTNGGVVAISGATAVTLNGAVNAGNATVGINANTAGVGGNNFTMAAGSSITTTDATGAAVAINVNAAGGGTGGAALRSITTGAGGTITVATNTGGNTTGGSISQTAATALNVGANGIVTLAVPTAGASIVGAFGANILTTSAGGTLNLTAGGAAFVTNTGNLTLAAPTLGANTVLSVISTGQLSLPAAAISTGTGNLTLRSNGGTLATNGALTTGSGNMTLVGSTGLTIGHTLTSGIGQINLSTTTSGDVTQNAGGNIVLTNGPLLTISARDAVTLNDTINAGFGSTVAINANTDGAGAQGFAMNAGSSITSTHTTGTAVAINVNAAGGGTGGAVLRSITAAGTSTIAVTTATGGNTTGGSITQAAGTLSSVGGTVALSTGAAASGIGTSGANIFTNADTVTASAGTGGIFITEADGANFTANVTGATGNIALTSTTGTLNIGGASATGGGTIALNSPDAITLGAALGSASSGAIAINANTDGAGATGFTQNAGGSITTGNAGAGAVAINVNAAGGGTGGAALRDITTGSGGTITVATNTGGNATGGSITQTGGTLLDTVTSGVLTLSTGGPASGITGIQTAHTSVTANTGTGGISITSSSPANFIGNVVGLTGDILFTQTTGGGLNLIGGATTTGGGSITLNSGGALFVQAALGSATTGPITINANTSGGVSNNFVMTGIGSITTGNAGAGAVAINVNAAGGGTGAASLQNITTGAGGTITVATNTGGNSTGGSITQAAGTQLNSGVGGTVALSTGGATSGIGTIGANILTNADTVTASARTGGVFITEANGASFAATATGVGNIALTSTTGNINIAGTTSTSSGNITLNASAGQITDTAALSTTGLLTTSSGASTVLDFGHTVSNFTGTNTGGGAFSLNNTTALTITGMTSTANGSIVVTNTGGLLTLTGDVISTFVGPGSGVSLSGAGVTQAGGTTVNSGGGTLSINGNGSAVTLAGTLMNSNATAGAVAITGATSLQLGNINMTGAAGAKTALTFTGAGSQAGGTTIQGANGALDINGGAFPMVLSGNNSYGGLTSINTGTVTATHANALGTTAGATTVANGANLTVNGGITVAENITLNGGNALTLTAAPTLSGTVGLSTADSTITTSDSGNATISGKITGPQGFNFTSPSGGGLLLTNNTNDYQGQTTVLAGSLGAFEANALGATTAGTTVNAGGTLGVGKAGGLTLAAENITLNGGTLAQSFTGGITVTIPGTVTLTADSVLAASSGNTLSITGQITGAGGFDIQSNGIVRISNATNDYAGNTSITGSGATLQLGAANVIPDGGGKGNVSVAGGALLDLNTFSETINGLTGAGTVNTAAGGTPTFTVGGNNQSSLFSGVIQNTAGTLALTKIGGGTLTLSGGNTYGGTTTISAGTLQIGNGGTTGTLGTGAVTDNAALSFTRSDTVTVANAISGTGSLTQAGAGTVILTGANSYGTTTISAGTLQIGNGGITGTLGGGAVTDNAALTFNRSDSVTVANFIAGTGSLTQAGSGTLVLTANNSYGATTISAGTLQVGNAGTTGTLGTGAVTDNAALTFNRTDTITVANVIGGTGSLTQAGSGTLVLTANNSYGATTISAGTLQIGSGGATGTMGTGGVTDNAALVFNRNNAHTVANAISGSGSLTQSGSGILTLSGNNSYGGLTTVSNGTTLEVASNNALGGTGAGTTIASGGTLQINGSGLLIPEPLTISGTGNGGIGAVRNLANTNTLSGQINTAGNATVTNAGGTLNLTGNMVGASTITYDVASGATIDESGIVSGGVGTNVVKDGQGTLIFSGASANTYDGTTTVNDGVLQAAKNGALGVGTGVAGDGTTVASGATLDINNAAIGNERVAIAGTGFPGAGGALTGTGVASLAGPLVLSANATVGGTGSLTVSGATSGANALSVIGGGNNTFTGTVNVASIDVNKTGGTAAFSNNVTTTGNFTTQNANFAVSLTGLNNSIGGSASFLNDSNVTIGQGGGLSAFNGGLSTTGAGGINTLNGTITTNNAAIALGNVALGSTVILNTNATTAAGSIGIANVTGNTNALTLQTGTGASVNATGAIGGVTTLTLANVGGTATLSGDVDVTALTVGASNVNVAFTGNGSSVTNAVNFQNTGTLTLGTAGGTQTYNGGLVISGPAGLRTLNGTLATSGDAISTGNVTLGSNTILNTTAGGNPGGANLTVGNVAGGGNDLTLNAGTTGALTTGALNAIGALSMAAATVNFGGGTLGSLDINATGAVTVNGNTTTTGTLALTGSGVTVNNQLQAGDNISISATNTGGTGDVTIAANIVETGGGGQTLTVRANNSIFFTTSADVSAAAPLTVVLNSDRDGSSAGAISLGSGTVINSNGGGISLVGGTTASGAAFGTGANTEGIRLDNAQLLSGAGLITLSGQGFGAAATNAKGVQLDNGSIVQSSSGNITITGTGGAAGSSAYGVGMDASTVRTTTTGNIAITGTNTNGAASDGQGVKIIGGAVQTVGAGTISITGTSAESAAAAVFLNGTSIGSGTASGDILLRATGGVTPDIVLTGTPTIQTTGNVTLNAGAGVSQANGSILAAGLRLLGGGTFSLGSPTNAVTTLAGTLTSGSTVSYTDANAIQIGSITSNDGTGSTTSNGLNVGTGTISLTTTAAASGITQTGAGVITADTLNLATTNGSAGLNGTTNAVTNLGATTLGSGALTLLDAGGLTVTGVVGATGGIALSTSGPLVINNALNGGGLVSLTTTGASGAGAISQNSSGIITATTLNLSTVDSNVALAGATNVVTNLGTTTLGSGSLNLLDAGGLTVTGVVGATGGVTINTSGPLAISSAINAAGGTVDLTTTGGGANTITQSGTGVITATTLNLATAGANVALNTLTNAVTNLGTTTLGAGSLTLLDAGGLNVTGPVGATGGVQLNTSGGALAVNNTIDATGNTVSLTTGGGVITQAGSSAIMADTLLLSTTGGSATLNGSTNVLTNLGTSNLGAGALNLLDAGGLNVTGAVTAGGVTLNTSGVLTVGAVVTSTGAVALTGFGSLAINAAINAAGQTVALTTTGGAGTTITQTAAITADTLTLSTAGTTVALNGATNVLTNLGTTTLGAGALNLLDTGGLTVTGPVTANGGVVLTTSGTLAVNNTINAGAGTISLNGTTGITETGSVITTGTLTGTSSGVVALGGANQVGTLGSFTSAGGFTLNDINGGLTLNNSISDPTGAVSISTAGGALALGNNNVTGLGVTLTGRGVTQGSASTVNGTTGTATVIGSDGTKGAIDMDGALNGANVTVRNATTVDLPNVTTAGTLTVGVGADITGAVSQPGTTISANTLTGSTGSTVLLSGNNQINNLGAFTSTGGFTLKDTTNGLLVNGAVSDSSNLVSLTTQGADLQVVNGSGSVTGVGVTLVDLDSSINIGGNVAAGSGTATLTAGSQIFQSGGVVSGASLVAAAQFGIGASGNVLQTQVGQIQASTNSGFFGIEINNTGNVNLAGITNNSGGFIFTNAGTVTVSAPISVTRRLSMTASGASDDIALNANVSYASAGSGGQPNRIIAGRNLTQAGGTTINSNGAPLFLTAGNANAAGTMTMNGAVAVQDLTATTNGGAMQLPSGTVTGALLATSNGGAITQAAGGIAVTGTSGINAGGALIALTDPANNFVGDVTLTNNGLNNVAITDGTGGIQFATSNVGSGTLTVVSTGVGGITQSGAITQAAGAGAASFTAGTNQIDLTQANDFTGVVTLSNSGGANAVQITDANAITFAPSLSLGGDFTVNAGGLITTSGVTNTGLQQYNGPLSTNGTYTTNGGNFNATGTTAITGTTTVSVGAGVATFTGAVEGPAALTVNSSAVNGETFSSTIGAVTPLASITTDAPGSVSLGGSVTTVGAQTFADAVNAGSITLTSTGGGTISAVNAANNFTGTLGISTVGGTASITDGTGGLTLGTVTAGTLNATSTGGAITAGVTTVTGVTTINAGSSAITMISGTNNFGGAVNLTGGTTSITDANALTLGTLNVGALTANATGALSLGTGNVGGALVANSNGGAITQSGPLVIAGTSNINSGSGLINLANTGNDFGGGVTAASSAGGVTFFDINTFTPTNITSGTGFMRLTAASIGGGIVGGSGNAEFNSTAAVTGLQVNFPTASHIQINGVNGPWIMTGTSSINPATYLGFTVSNLRGTMNGVDVLFVDGAAAGAAAIAASNAAQEAAAAAGDIFGTDSVAQQIEYGFAGDVGNLPPIDHRLQGVGISVPKCFNESREGESCGTTP